MINEFGKESVWNFLSDLGPILNLFGEGITKQFLSGSLYLEDHILLATLPIGILTISVSAIRVAGPAWLKALIGRAGEPRGRVELELMSSTSQFVCELWDGQAMVRVLATSPVREIIVHIIGEQGSCDLFKLEDALDDDHEVLIQTSPTCSIIGSWIYIFFKVKPHSPESQVSGPRTITKLDPYRSLRPGQTRVPNVVLNVGGYGTHTRLFLAASFGLLVQFGVLAVLYLTSYTPYIGKHPDGFLPVQRYIFGLVTAGTVAVSVGALICSMIIDSSTIETKYILKHQERSKLLVFWIQKGGPINDQDFGSYAIFPRQRQNRLISSHPVSYKRDQEVFDEAIHGNMVNPIAQDDQASAITRITVTVASFLTFSGFLIQLIGLRGMPLAAPLAVQVGTAIMLIVRLLVRHNSGMNPHIVVLPARFELDKLALDFTQAGSVDKFWRRLDEKSSHTQENENREVAGTEAGLLDLKPTPNLSRCPDKTQMSFAVVGNGADGALITPVRWDSTSLQAPLESPSPVETAIEIREDLGRVTGMSSGAAPLATNALICALEGIMDYLFPGSDRAKQQRQRPLDLYKPKALPAPSDRTHRPVHANEDSKNPARPRATVSFPLRITTTHSDSKAPTTQEFEMVIKDLPGYGWQVNYSELEAILSLSCYTMQRHCAMVKSHLYEVTPQSGSHAPENIVLDLLGDAGSNNTLVRWWIKAYTDSLLQVSPVMEEGESLPDCPKTRENSFRIRSSNVIGTGHNKALSPDGASQHLESLNFAFRRHDSYNNEDLGLEDFIIDSRKVFVPVSSRDQDCSGGTQQHDTKSDDRGWILATVSVTSLEFATAQTIYASFLDSLFASPKAKETLRELIAKSTTRVTTAPHLRKGEFNVYNFLERDCRLQNDVIDRLLHVVRESGLYEGGAGGDLRVVSALAHADLLPTAIDTDRLLSFTR